MKTKFPFSASVFLLTATFLLLPSCQVKYDTVTFQSAGSMPAVATPIPDIDIDTNVTAGMFGGAVKSHKPYDIQSGTFHDALDFAEFTKVIVTYADGTVDPGSAALKLPMRVAHRIYESPNSMAGGAVVVTKSRLIQAEFPRAVSRDESFTLEMEGSFTKDDGTVIPFKIKEKYNISRDKRSESWADFVSGC